MTPLSMEKESVGRPAMFQALILIGSPNVLLRLKSLLHGTFRDCSDMLHCELHTYIYVDVGHCTTLSEAFCRLLSTVCIVCTYVLGHSKSLRERDLRKRGCLEFVSIVCL